MFDDKIALRCSKEFLFEYTYSHERIYKAVKRCLTDSEAIKTYDFGCLYTLKIILQLSGLFEEYNEYKHEQQRKDLKK